MIFKFKKHFCFLLMISIALSSCAKTPESVTSSSENTSASYVNCETASLEEMSKNVDEYVSTLGELELDNMAFSEYLEIDIPDYVPTGKYICPDNFQDNYAKIFSYYDEDYDEANAVDDGTTYPTGPTYINEEKNLEMSIGCDGFFSYNKDFDSQKYYNESEIVETYTASQLESCDEKYKLENSSSEISVRNAAELAKEFVDDFVKNNNYSNEFVVSRVMLCETDDGYFYEIGYTQKVDGVNILEYASTYDESLSNLICPTVFAYICSDEINNFCVNYYLDEYEIEGEYTEVFDLVETSEYLSQKLASKMNLKVQRVALEYCMIYTENVQEAEDGESYREDIAPWATACSYDVYEPQICWVFYFDETPEGEVYAMVNCEDLSVTYVDNT